MKTPAPLDVIVVPDFSSARAAMFEARTLFFLASWLENAGRARDWPLHVACIGEPPPSVQNLARRCGARVTVHAPLRLVTGDYTNKLRGLEVSPETAHLLLLDADVLVLGDLGQAPLVVGEGLAAAPAGKLRVPAALWPSIYAAVDGEVPQERIAPLRAELGFADRDQRMPPYFNGGIVAAPWSCGLRQLWEDHILRITARLRHLGYEQAVARHVLGSDQAGLATTIQALRSRGLPFSRLPGAYHATRTHFKAGALRLRDVRLLHANGFMRDVKDVSEIAVGMESYLAYWRRGIRRTKPGRGLAVRILVGHLQQRRMGHRLRTLYHRHVRPALEAAGADLRD